MVICIEPVKSVAKGPSSASITLIPNARTSAASALGEPASANFEAQ